MLRLRLPIAGLVPALLAALPLATQAQAPVDSVVRTTTVVTTTTTTVTKPAASGSKPAAPVSTSSSTTTTTTEPAASVPAARQPAPGDLTGARPRPAPTATPAATTTPAAPAKSSASAKPTASAKPAPAPRPKTTATAVPASRTTTAATTTAATRRSAKADPELVHFLQTDVDLTLVRADQLPNLYERFMETTRAERRQWTTAQWATASTVLARLNQRYEQVRGELSLEEKLNVRTLQGEFRGLEAAKSVSKRL